MMRLGGALGQLPIEKTFELARQYHNDHKKAADRTLAPFEKEKMSGLYAHIIHGNWSDSKNAIRRRLYEKTTMGKEWAGLESAEKEQAMAAYVIMVDQIHKGFTSYIDHRVKKLKFKEAKKKAAEENSKKKDTQAEKRKKAKPKQPTEKKMEIPISLTSPEEGFFEDFDADQPSGSSGSRINMEPDENETIYPPNFDNFDCKEPEKRESGTQTSSKLIDKLEHHEERRIRALKLLHFKTHVINANKPSKSDREDGQDPLPRHPPGTTDLAAMQFNWTSEKFGCALDDAIGDDLENIFKRAQASLFTGLNQKRINPDNDNIMFLLSSFAYVTGRDTEDMAKSVRNFDQYKEDFPVYLSLFEERDKEEISVEFILTVVKNCPDFANAPENISLLAIANDMPHTDDIEDEEKTQPTVHPLQEESSEEENLQRISAHVISTGSDESYGREETDQQRHARLRREALDRLQKDMDQMRANYKMHVEAQIARGELSPDTETDIIKAHSNEHTYDDCEDAIDYFSNRVWHLYKQMTPNVLTTLDVLKWCEETIAKNKGDGSTSTKKELE